MFKVTHELLVVCAVDDPKSELQILHDRLKNPTFRKSEFARGLTLYAVEEASYEEEEGGQQSSTNSAASSPSRAEGGGADEDCGMWASCFGMPYFK